MLVHVSSKKISLKAHRISNNMVLKLPAQMKRVGEGGVMMIRNVI